MGDDDDKKAAQQNSHPTSSTKPVTAVVVLNCLTLFDVLFAVCLSQELGSRATPVILLVAFISIAYCHKPNRLNKLLLCEVLKQCQHRTGIFYNTIHISSMFIVELSD